EERITRRLGPERAHRLAQACRRSRRAWPLFLRTTGWRKFATYAKDLFAWMEEEGLRPPGTNPLNGMRRGSEPPPLTAGRGRVLHWCTKVLAYPRLTPQERAVLFLLQNGLSPGEARSLRISHLDLAQGICTVDTGTNVRRVPLFPRTTAAITSWLRVRSGMS